MPPDLKIIDRRLRAGLGAARVVPPPELEGRIIAALDGDGPAVPLTRSPVTRSCAPSYLSAAGLLLLVGALAFAFGPGTTRPMPVAATAPLAPARPLNMEFVIGIDTTRYASLVNDRAGHLVAAFESPLFDQARRIVADAHHAVGTVLSRIPAPVRVETTTSLPIHEAGEG